MAAAKHARHEEIDDFDIEVQTTLSLDHYVVSGNCDHSPRRDRCKSIL
jgi:hypothetical protein